MIQTPIHFRAPLVTFQATRGTKCVFKTFSNSHHTFLRPTSSCQSILDTLGVFFATRRPWLFFLFVLYTVQFSKDLCQIHQKCSLGHNLDPSVLSLPVSDHCGHHGPTLSFLVCILQGRVFNGSSSNLYQIFIRPRTGLPSIFVTQLHSFSLCKLKPHIFLRLITRMGQTKM